MTSPYPPPVAQPAVPVTSPPSGGVGVVRHLLSVVVALVAVPLAYLGIDYAIWHRLTAQVQTFADGPPPAQALVPLVLAGFLLLVAAASGRISGLGPLVAGVVWGAAPALWILFAPRSHLRLAGDLPDVYDGFTFGITGVGAVLYPVMAALLLGCAISGRWRR